ncbi:MULTISPECIES: hypothetical protein [unclassified Kitasatospora]|uniref:hypothetical protein n=1 Tax=unclassified Kitasatospora TaxID=2633591 RepID=UPI00070EF342|nr:MULTISPECIES: hypothetical protein [unclassified Kitasatospora]KQV23971.1 hypothetical protein ASC99_01820 [Kitasatospora sp. Root107]KRB67316.1 hypothetical protein ASE03_02915 [Kitasatospora sp. Root187]
MAGQQFGAPGPFRVGPKILFCLVPLLSLGLLGLVPSLVLALRRRRAVDVLGAVVFVLLQLTLYVSVGLSKPDGQDVFSLIGGLALLALWLGAPVHFLVLDSRSGWGTPKTVPPVQTAAWYPAPQYPAAPPAPPLPAPAQPAPQASAPTQDDLQQLGELLRRQAQDGSR